MFDVRRCKMVDKVVSNIKITMDTLKEVVLGRFNYLLLDLIKEMRVSSFCGLSLIELCGKLVAAILKVHSRTKEKVKKGTHFGRIKRKK